MSEYPLVSVILPVYNGAKYLRESIECILNQTYKNFEFIIINDGSKDNSEEIIKSFADSRIKYTSQPNQGLAATLNNAIALSSGTYIARQDQDDISLPERFEKQVKFLETNPDTGMVGTWSQIIYENELTERKHEHPFEDYELRFNILLDNPFVHSSVMIRKTVFEEVGVYSTDKLRQPPEDYELWSRIYKKFKMANIPQILHHYREVAQSMSRAGNNPFLEKVLKINTENIQYLSLNGCSIENIFDIACLHHGAYDKIKSRVNFKKIKEYIKEITIKISEQNPEHLDKLQKKADFILKSMVYRYFLHKYGKITGKIFYKLYFLFFL